MPSRGEVMLPRPAPGRDMKDPATHCEAAPAPCTNRSPGRSPVLIPLFLVWQVIGW